jgi:CDP-paratose synthetase
LMKQKTILLTGATGFLGSHLLESFMRAGYEVLVLKRSKSDLWRIKHLCHQLKLYNIDEISPESIFGENKIDFVVHTATSYGRKNESIPEVIQTNLIFGLALLDAAIKNNVKCFVNADTLLPKDINAYALSKNQFAAWLELESKKIQVINLKIEHMYGPKDDIKKLVPWVICQLKLNAPSISLTPGNQLRDFVHIDDVVSAFITSIEQLSKLDYFNEFEVGTGLSIPVRQFIEHVKLSFENHNGKSDTKLDFGKQPYRSGEPMHIKVNNQNLIKLGWSPKTSYKEGINNLMTHII